MSKESGNGIESNQDQNLRDAYLFARETRDHADALLWEVGAIVWGGQTLLLGFVLEAIGGNNGPFVLIVAVALIGILMASFNQQIMSARLSVCAGMVRIMMDIEDQLKMPTKPQQMLSGDYPAGLQSRWSKLLNKSFQFVWVLVIVDALWRLLRPFFGKLGWS